MKSDDKFSLTEIAAALNVTNPRAGQLARHFLDDGLIAKVSESKGVFFVRRTQCSLRHKSWRTHTNEELGISDLNLFGQAGR